MGDGPGALEGLELTGGSWRRRCRSCGWGPLTPFLSFGEMPLADALVDDPDQAERRYPLEVVFCEGCRLTQLLYDVEPRELFVANYPYFSSYSEALVDHGRRHARSLVRDRDLGPGSLVVEIASNDGYLLRNFLEERIDVLGIDPAPAQADAAEAAGVPTRREFFDADLARKLRGEGVRPDVVIANNVLAHTPDPNGFVEGLAALLEPPAVATIENPSVVALVEQGAFDTIYHEHFSYLSTTSVVALMARHGLVVGHVEPLDIHGGSLRWTVGPAEVADPTVRDRLAAEDAAGATSPAFYEGFADRVRRQSTRLREMLEDRRSSGRRIAAYGAAAKGSTLLNAAGIGADLVDYVVDRNPHKQGRYLPGVRIPIDAPERLVEDQPDDVLLLAWNFADEILDQQAAYRRAGGRFIIPIPTPTVV